MAILIVIILGLALAVSQWLMRRKLEVLNSDLDSAMAELDESALDFFRSKRMKCHLTNLGYIGLLRHKVKKLQAKIAEVGCGEKNPD